jgi:polyphosphate kinase
LSGGAKRPAAGADETLFFGRDESWMLFNQRVLEEAEDANNPLLERVKFLAITASNLDEFIEIRVASLLQRIEDGFNEPQRPDEGGLTLQQRLDRLSVILHDFVEAQYVCLNERLLPALRAENIHILKWRELTDRARAHALEFYEAEVDPLLTPVTIDPSHPFPRVLNKALCLALLLRYKRKGKVRDKSLPKSASVLGVVTVPRALPRLVPLPSEEGRSDFIPLHDLIDSQVERMFRGYEVLTRAAFRVTRNSNLYLQEEESRNLLESVRSELHNRRKGDAVRMEIESTATEEIAERLRINFELDAWQVFRTAGPVNLSRLMQLPNEVARADLKYPKFHGRRYNLSAKSTNLFDEVRAKDILLHHPFDSYGTVEDFIEFAAADPAVVSMKQTLYRTSADSPLFTALTDAAQSKEATAVIELMARFDEASNIRWAREMEDAGVGVFHGILGLKTHCKLALMVRRDPDGVVRRYAHLGTGNYNTVTARFYTDISLLTARPEITRAVQAVFRFLTAESESETYAPLLVAPLTLAPGILALINREAEHAKSGTAGGDCGQDERAARPADGGGVVCGVECGRRDRPDRARHVLAAAGGEGCERTHSRAFDCGTVSRTQPDLQLRERRPSGGLLRQRGLDAAQSLRALRGGVSDPRSGARRSSTRGDSGSVFGGQREGAPAAAGWQVRPRAEERPCDERAGPPDGAVRGRPQRGEVEAAAGWVTVR